MRVLLADPPARGTRLDDSYANLGLLYLAGTLRAALGTQVELQYLGPKHDLASHIEQVRRFNPHVYAIGFTSKAPRVSYRTLGAVREVLPNALLVAGGCHPTALPGEVLACSPADVVVAGEGEVTFTALIERYMGGGSVDYSGIAGLYWRVGDQIQTSGKRPLIKDLDRIPFPAWDLIDFRDYPGMHLKKQPVESSLLISRGCPFHCAFCSQPIWKLQKPWLRSRSAENICEEIELLYDRGVREIYLCSDELNFSEKWALELCRAIAQLKHSDLFFQCNLRADKMTPELAEALASIRCWLVHLGVESANNRVLQGIGKKVTIEQVTEATRLLAGAGIKVFAFMMLYQAWEEDGQLHFETPAEVRNSLRWARKMFREKQIHYMSWQFCTPMPGARLFDIAAKYGLYRGRPEEVWEAFDEHALSMRLPGVSERRMRWDLKKGILLKDWFMLRSGAISLRHLWRAWENVAALVR